MPRFNKALVESAIQAHIDTIQQDWGFDPRSGTAQLKTIAHDRLKTNPIPCAEHNEDLHFEAALMAYGEYRALERLAEKLGLQSGPHTTDMEAKRCLHGYVRYIPRRTS